MARCWKKAALRNWNGETVVSYSFLFPTRRRRRGYWSEFLNETRFSVQDDYRLRVDCLDLPVGKLVVVFVENGLEVNEAHTCEESLEDYFKRVTGGEGIA